MNIQVEKGKVLLVSGPASVITSEGKMTLFGANLPLGNKVVVRKKRTLPFEAEENAVLDVTLGGEAQIEEVTGSTIPNCWNKAVKEILSSIGLSTTIILGDIDCGKTSFCTFLANKALNTGVRTAIIDGDLGQSDVGSPTTVGMSLVSKPITDLFTLEPHTLFFAGLTSPSGVTERLITGIRALKVMASEMGIGVIIINTDGWVKGDEAKNYKTALVKETHPEAVVGIQRNDEVENILSYAEKEGFNVFRIASPLCIKKRNSEERKELREQGYRKFLEGATLRSLPMGWVEMEYTPLGTGMPLVADRLKDVETVLGHKPLYCEENSEELFIVSKENDKIHQEDIMKVVETFKKRLYIVKDGDEKGLIVGLLDKNKQFLGLGTIEKIDFENRVLRIYTPYKDKIGIIQFGQIKIDEKGKEEGIVKSFST
ncbi:MAG: polynucleotide 5-hydroxyl-kinase [Thermoproteota archaeon]|nr:polynucleotide 5-hydroxyl-kinase [Thermoproteota archaeon]